MKLLLKLGIYFIIFLIVYNLFILLFSNNIIESLYNFNTDSENDVKNKCKGKIIAKHGDYESNEGHVRVESCRRKYFSARKRCNRRRNRQQDENNRRNARNNARTNRNNDRNNKRDDCLKSYRYSGYVKDFDDKTVYSEIANSHIVTDPPHTQENSFELGKEMVKYEVVTAVHNDPSMNTVLRNMIDTEIESGLKYDTYKTKYNQQLSDFLKEKYKIQETKRRNEFTDVDNNQIIGDNYESQKGSLLIENGNEQYSEIYMQGDEGQLKSLNTVKNDIYGRSNTLFKNKYTEQSNNYLSDWHTKLSALLDIKKTTSEDVNAGIQM
jgi:hypothetical protein